MSFKAYCIHKDSSHIDFVDLDFGQLDAGEVLIKACYSSVNYKDVLAATGAGKVIRRFPCIPGVDVAGVVCSSSDSRFNKGDKVLVTGYGMGVSHHGGWAEYVRVPADWLVAVPAELSLLEVMALGTAGFTAALAIHRLEQNDLAADNGKVLVTGATGGVSSWIIQMLAQKGFQVVALTRKADKVDYLKQLGASEVLLSEQLLMGNKPLESASWHAAFDSVGGETLAWLTRSMLQNGLIACYGNTGGVVLNTTVLPFILRGIRLIGIDSAATQQPLRRLIWQRLASDLKPQQIDLVTQVYDWEKLTELLPAWLNGTMTGRVVLKIADVEHI